MLHRPARVVLSLKQGWRSIDPAPLVGQQELLSLLGARVRMRCVGTSQRFETVGGSGKPWLSWGRIRFAVSWLLASCRHWSRAREEFSWPQQAAGNVPPSALARSLPTAQLIVWGASALLGFARRPVVAQPSRGINTALVPRALAAPRSPFPTHFSIRASQISRLPPHKSNLHFGCFSSATYWTAKRKESRRCEPVLSQCHSLS